MSLHRCLLGDRRIFGVVAITVQERMNQEVVTEPRVVGDWRCPTDVWRDCTHWQQPVCRRARASNCSSSSPTNQPTHPTTNNQQTTQPTTSSSPNNQLTHTLLSNYFRASTNPAILAESIIIRLQNKWSENCCITVHWFRRKSVHFICQI